jgi:outer membrane protein
MKKIIYILACIAISTASFAQRYAYVNTDYILKNIPAFTEAQKKIDQLSEEWKTEIEKRQKEIDDAYRAFQNEQYLMTEDQKKAKIQDIEAKEKALKEFQKQKFGYEGELFKKRQELIKPIQDKVYDAIEKLAKERGYDFVFDKAGSTTILYADTKNDRSDDIIRNLGYTPGQNN